MLLKRSKFYVFENYFLKKGVVQQLPMLYAVLFVQCVWKYVGVVEGNLYFFCGEERREGKSSFAVFGFGAGGADCKCAFSFAVDFAICFVVNIGII